MASEVEAVVEALGRADASLPADDALVSRADALVEDLLTRSELAASMAQAMMGGAEWLTAPLLSAASSTARQLLRKVVVAAARSLLPPHSNRTWLAVGDTTEDGGAAAGAGPRPPMMKHFCTIVDGLIAAIPTSAGHSDTWTEFWLALVDLAVSGHSARRVLHDRGLVWRALHLMLGDETPLAADEVPRVELPREARQGLRCLPLLDAAATLLMHADTARIVEAGDAAAGAVAHEPYRPSCLLPRDRWGTDATALVNSASLAETVVGAARRDSMLAPYAWDDVSTDAPLLVTGAREAAVVECPPLYRLVLADCPQPVQMARPLCAFAPRWCLGDPKQAYGLKVAHAVVRSTTLPRLDRVPLSTYAQNVEAGWLLWGHLARLRQPPGHAELLAKYIFGLVGREQGGLGYSMKLAQQQQNSCPQWLFDATARFVSFAVERDDAGELRHPGVVAHAARLARGRTLSAPNKEAFAWLAQATMAHETRCAELMRKFFELESLAYSDHKPAERKMLLPPLSSPEIGSQNGASLSVSVVFDPAQPDERLPLVRYTLRSRSACSVRVYLQQDADEHDTCHTLPPWGTSREGLVVHLKGGSETVTIHEGTRTKQGRLWVPSSFFTCALPTSSEPRREPPRQEAWTRGVRCYVQRESLRVLVAQWGAARERRRALLADATVCAFGAVWSHAPRALLAEVCMQLHPGLAPECGYMTPQYQTNDCPACTLRNERGATHCRICGTPLP